MNSNPPPSPEPGWRRLARRLAGRRALAVAAGVVLVLLAVALGAGRRGAAGAAAPVYEAKRGPLTISLAESGTIQSREKVVVRSEVGGRSTVIWLIDEGKVVAKGDLLVELDSSNFEDQRVQAEIVVQNSEAALIQARENLEVTKNQARADTDEAELKLRFARMDLEKYEQGEYPQLRQQAEADITIAGEELQRARDTLDWSQKLAAGGHVTRSEVQADELALKRRTLDVEIARGKLDLLARYTSTQTVQRLASDIRQAEMALERTKRKASADVIRAEAELRAKQSEHDQQKAKLERILRQIANCRVLAPSGGMVVYATTSQGRRWGSNEPLKTGQEVVERQELIHLPAASEMMAEVKIPEASLTKVRPGLPARVTVDALPGRAFPARLERIGVLPDSADAWLNPDLKLYACQVHLEEGSAELRPGMSCRVEILVEEHADAVYVPVQCVLRVAGKPTVYVQGRRAAEPRTVRVGLDNNRMIHVIEGLAAGEKVLLAPPLPPSATGESGARQGGWGQGRPAGEPNGAPAGDAGRPPAGAGPGLGERPAGPPGEGRPSGDAPGPRESRRSRPPGSWPPGGAGESGGPGRGGGGGAPAAPRDGGGAGATP